MMKLPGMISSGLSTLGAGSAAKGGEKAAESLVGGKSGSGLIATGLKIGVEVPAHASSGEAGEAGGAYGKPGTDLSKLLGALGKSGALGQLSKTLEPSASADDAATPGSDGKNDAQKVAGKLSNLTGMIPVLSNLTGGIANSNGSLGGMVKGAASGVLKTADGAFNGAKKMVESGVENPIAIGVGAGFGALATSDGAPTAVKGLAKKLVG